MVLTNTQKLKAAIIAQIVLQKKSQGQLQEMQAALATDVGRLALVGNLTAVLLETSSQMPADVQQAYATDIVQRIERTIELRLSPPAASI